MHPQQHVESFPWFPQHFKRLLGFYLQRIRRHKAQWHPVHASRAWSDMCHGNHDRKLVTADGHFLLDGHQRRRLGQQLLPSRQLGSALSDGNRKLITLCGIPFSFGFFKRRGKIQIYRAEFATCFFAANRRGRHAKRFPGHECLSIRFRTDLDGGHQCQRAFHAPVRGRKFEGELRRRRAFESGRDRVDLPGGAGQIRSRFGPMESERFRMRLLNGRFRFPHSMPKRSLRCGFARKLMKWLGKARWIELVSILAHQHERPAEER